MHSVGSERQLTEHSDPISAMRPAVYPPVTLEGRLSANDNSSFQFDQELGELAGLYKPAVPDSQHHLPVSYPPTLSLSTINKIRLPVTLTLATLAAQLYPSETAWSGC